MIEPKDTDAVLGGTSAIDLAANQLKRDNALASRMDLRLHGSVEDAKAWIAFLGNLDASGQIELLAVSDLYPDRNPSSAVRVYVKARLRMQ